MGEIKWGPDSRVLGTTGKVLGEGTGAALDLNT